MKAWVMAGRYVVAAMALAAAACSDDDRAGERSALTDDGGDGTWRGAPCEECDLATQVPRLADVGAEDCGSISLDADSASGSDCAHAALQAGRPFSLVIEEAGSDSNVSTAWVFAGGHLLVVTYDSNVCGGITPTCDSPGCGPRVATSTCVDPTPSAAPRAIFDCAGRADLRALCEPVS